MFSTLTPTLYEALIVATQLSSVFIYALILQGCGDPF